MALVSKMCPNIRKVNKYAIIALKWDYFSMKMFVRVRVVAILYPTSKTKNIAN